MTDDVILNESIVTVKSNMMVYRWKSQNQSGLFLLLSFTNRKQVRKNAAGHLAISVNIGSGSGIAGYRDNGARHPIPDTEALS